MVPIPPWIFEPSLFNFVIYVVKNEQDYQSYTLKELLPYGFGGDAIR